MKGAIYLFHILFVVSLLAYLGIQIYNQQKIDVYCDNSYQI